MNQFRVYTKSDRQMPIHAITWRVMGIFDYFAADAAVGWQPHLATPNAGGDAASDGTSGEWRIINAVAVAAAAEFAVCLPTRCFTIASDLTQPIRD